MGFLPKLFAFRLTRAGSRRGGGGNHGCRKRAHLSVSLKRLNLLLHPVEGIHASRAGDAPEHVVDLRRRLGRARPGDQGVLLAL